MSPKSVLLLSGGLDSYTAGAIAKADGYEVNALTIRYGQVHAREIEAARQVAAALGVSRHLELEVPLSKIASRSACSSNSTSSSGVLRLAVYKAHGSWLMEIQRSSMSHKP